TAKVKPQRPRKKINRIFISRRAAKKGRHILNEDELFDMLSKYGFKKYVLEQISVEEQIALFSDSEYVIGSHGAGLSNIIFAEEIDVLEIFPTKEILPHFYFLAKSLEHNYQYWCGQATSKNSNFVVNVSDIEKIIASRELSPTQSFDR
ncbi:MAG: glycosyltransferase family 61 protein, partial [Chroococcidiopsis sp.]